jgi:Mat/Ecp fimbriae outer membrane usher protein
MLRRTSRLVAAVLASWCAVASGTATAAQFADGTIPDSNSEGLTVDTPPPSLTHYLDDFVRARPTARRELKQPAAEAPTATAVPAGFETLMLEQTTQVDVFFANRFLASTLATFSPTTISFENPAIFVHLIPTMLDENAVAEALSGVLATNSELQCVSQQQVNCGSLAPEVADVIFDADSYRVDVFINPSLLALQSNIVRKFLAPSSAGLSFFQTFNVASTGTRSSSLFSFNGRTILSYQETSLELLSDVATNSRAHASSLNLQRDREGRRYQAGFLTTNSSGLKFSTNSSILGFRAGTTLDTREDLRQTTGNAIEIFLPLRARVSLFKDGRLLSGRFYEPGNQQLDTSSLPGGAYDVEILISDATGDRRETRFYSKSSRLPPADQPQFFIEGGRVTVESTTSLLPEVDRGSLLRAGYTSRINDSSSYMLGLTMTEGDAMVEAGWFGVYPWLESSFDVALLDRQRRGINASLRFPVFFSQVLIDHRQIWNPDTGDIIGQSQRQTSISTSLPLGRSSLSLAARTNSRSSTGEARTYAATYHFPVLRLGRANLRSNLQWTQQNGAATLLLSVGLFSGAQHFSYSMDADYSREQTPDGPIRSGRGGASINYRNDASSPTELQTRFHARHQESGDIFGLELDSRGRFGRFRGQVETDPGNGGESRYNTNYAASLVATSAGVAFGGQEQNRAAIIIDLSATEAADNYFDVLVNSSQVATALPGRRTVVAVTPYDEYEVSLRARGVGFVSLTDRTHRVTLYPGNAVNLVWEADAIVILFGEITDQATGQPIADALIHGVMGLATTDAGGSFQAEVSPSTRQLTFETVQQRCQLTLPPFTAVDGIAFLDPVSCHMVDK